MCMLMCVGGVCVFVSLYVNVYMCSMCAMYVFGVYMCVCGMCMYMYVKYVCVCVYGMVCVVWYGVVWYMWCVCVCEYVCECV